ncbi:pilus assembly protein PilM [Patescibacteria group bacterium]|nr:pilus assembly protein PilM [Patescibacteria group bacterium]
MNLQSLLQKYPQMKVYWEKTIKLLKAETIIGGISISSEAIRYIRLNSKKEIEQKIGVTLEPGVIVNGNLKNKKAFLSALRALRSRLGNPEIHVIVSLPSDKVYIKSFNLPVIKDRLLEEAAKLNLQLLSPIDIKGSYTDWEKIGKVQEEGEKLEILGAFVNKTTVDDYVSVFREADFGIVAVEFPALSLARLAKDSFSSGQTGSASENKPYIILSVSSDGSEFIVVNSNGSPCFNYFVSWGSIEGRQITLDKFNDTLAKEMKKVLNFYSSHWNCQVTDLILVTRGLYTEIENIIKTNCSSINIKSLIVNEKFSKLNPSWYSVLGAAIRGGVPRSEDIFISLIGIGTEQRFFESRVTFFVRTWRTAVLSTLSVLVAFFVFGDLFFMQLSNNLDRQISFIIQKEQGQEVSSLNEEAKKFNTLVAKALVAESKSKKISHFFDIFNNLAGKEIEIQRVLFDPLKKTTLITAIAKDNQSVINFKNVLAEREEFKDVEFSFTSTVTNSDGTIFFPITFKLNS